jgi:hypothetical protein
MFCFINQLMPQKQLLTKIIPDIVESMVPSDEASEETILYDGYEEEQTPEQTRVSTVEEWH